MDAEDLNHDIPWLVPWPRAVRRELQGAIIRGSRRHRALVGIAVQAARNELDGGIGSQDGSSPPAGVAFARAALDVARSWSRGESAGGALCATRRRLDTMRGHMCKTLYWAIADVLAFTDDPSRNEFPRP